MRSNTLKSILFIIFLSISFIGNAQLIDPFGKIITHEIKLEKLKDGTYAGAVEWTTGGLDSLQRFIINGLDVKAPVMVRIISKAPDHNIDLGFYKSGWDKVESKIATDGEKFAEKTFRTMNTAGLGVYSRVAGIPYIISVKVGLQFPSTQSLIRITDDKDEYSRHMRKMGFGGQLFSDDGSNNSNVTNTNDSNNTLTYIVIGLLVIIILLLAIFLLKKKSSKNTTLLIVIFGLSQFCLAQSSQPKLIPIDGQGNSPVFYEYSTQNVGSQKTVPIDKPRVRDTNVTISIDESGTFVETHPVRIESNPGSIELSPAEAEDIMRRMGGADDAFNRDYGEDSPGDDTQGDQRTLDISRNTEELNRLRRQIEQLQQQVDLLSQEDQEYDQDDFGAGEILLYCEDLRACRECIQDGARAFNTHRAYFAFLQKYYLRKTTELNDWITYGNSLASIPNAGLGWGPIYLNVVVPAMEDLKSAYDKKFDEYITSMESDLEMISTCYSNGSGSFRSRDGYEAQVFSIIEALKASKIHK